MNREIYPEIFIDHNNLLQPLSIQEFDNLFLKYKNGDKNAREIIISHNIRLALYIAKKYSNTGYDINDLFSIGLVGLVKAVDTFDLSKKCTFATYAVRCIHNEILMFLRKNKTDCITFSLNEVKFFGHKGEEISLEDFLVNPDVNIMENYEKMEMIQEIMEIVNQLSKKEKEIIYLFFGFYDDRCYSQREIARKIGISQSHISRVLTRTLNKIKLKYEMRSLICNEHVKVKK